MTIREILNTYGLTLKQLSDRFNIPIRTVEDWSRGVRNPPKYVVEMIKELLKDGKK